MPQAVLPGLRNDESSSCWVVFTIPGYATRSNVTPNGFVVGFAKLLHLGEKERTSADQCVPLIPRCRGGRRWGGGSASKIVHMLEEPSSLLAGEVGAVPAWRYEVIARANAEGLGEPGACPHAEANGVLGKVTGACAPCIEFLNVVLEFFDGWSKVKVELLSI